MVRWAIWRKEGYETSYHTPNVCVCDQGSVRATPSLHLGHWIIPFRFELAEYEKEKKGATSFFDQLFNNLRVKIFGENQTPTPSNTHPTGNDTGQETFSSNQPLSSFDIPKPKIPVAKTKPTLAPDEAFIQAALENIRTKGHPLSKLILIVNVQQQEMYLVDKEGNILERYPVSTGKGGTSKRPAYGSHQTPTGTLRIKTIVGRGAVKGTIFRGLRPVGKEDNLEQEDAREDALTTRVITMDNLDCPEDERTLAQIRIHGTNEEPWLGKKAGSRGCIRMGNDAIIKLAEQVGPNTLVEVVG